MVPQPMWVLLPLCQVRKTKSWLWWATGSFCMMCKNQRENRAKWWQMVKEINLLLNFFKMHFEVEDKYVLLIRFDKLICVYLYGLLLIANMIAKYCWTFWILFCFVFKVNSSFDFDFRLFRRQRFDKFLFRRLEPTSKLPNICYSQW